MEESGKNLLERDIPLIERAVEFWESNEAESNDRAWAYLALSNYQEPGTDPELSRMLELALRDALGQPTSLMACKNCGEFYYSAEIGEWLSFSNWATWLRIYRQGGFCEWCKEN